MDLEREELRRRYQLCRAGFALNAVGLGLLCLNSAFNLAFLLTFEREILVLLRSPIWDWLVGAPITWTTLIGSYLLWGRSADPAWQRRAGLLVLMNFVDILLWTLEHGGTLGLRLGGIGHDWFRPPLGRGLGWFEFLLFARLATDMGSVLGKPKEPEAGVTARALATIGLIFWIVSFLTQTHWRHGWPLVNRPIRRGTLWMWLGSNVLMMVT